MITYDYESLFKQDSIDKQLSIVSDDTTINITNDDIVSEKFELTESLCSEQNLKFGAVESSKIVFTVKNSMPKMMKKWLTVTITPYGASEAFTIGRFYVRKEKPSSDRKTKEITAYDGIYPILQKTYKGWYKSAFGSTRKMTVKQFRDSFFTRLHTTHTWLTQETVTLPNDDVEIKLVKKTSKRELNGKAILEAICEINGVFGHIGRDNVFHYVQLHSGSSSIDMPNSLTISVDYEDYTTKQIDRVELFNSKGGILYASGEEDEDADNTYVVENNFLINGLTKANAITAANALLDVLSGVQYIPIDTEYKGDPCLEVGDHIKCHANNQNIESFILQRRMTGIQSLHDFYTATGDDKYPDVSTTTTAKIKTLDAKIGTIDASDYNLESANDGDLGDIGYSDSDNESVNFVNNDPEYDGKQTKHYWFYNANWSSPYWATYKGVVKSDRMPFIIAEVPEDVQHQTRTLPVDGKDRQAKCIYLIGRWEGYAGSVLSQFPVEQEWKKVSGVSGSTPATFGSKWNNMYGLGSIVSKEYFYCSIGQGTTAVGLIDEDTPADYSFDSWNDLLDAVANEEVIIDETSPSDYRMKLPTQTTASAINKVLAEINSVLSTNQSSNTRSLRSAAAVSDSEDTTDFIVGTNLMNDNNLSKIAGTIKNIATTLRGNVNNIIESSDNESRTIVAKLMSGASRKIANIPTFLATRSEPDDYQGTLYNNSLLFKLGTNSEINIAENTNGEHDWSFGEDGFSFDNLGWWFNTEGNRDSASHPNQYCTFKITGLTSGSTHTFTFSEYVKPYSCKRSFLIWSYNNTGLGYEVHRVTIQCSVPFVVSCYKYNNNNYQFTYNGVTYTKNPYWLHIVVNAGSSGTPTMTYTDTILQQEETSYNIQWNSTPTQPLQWQNTSYYMFGAMEGGTVMGMLNDSDMDYVYADATALAEGINSVSWSHNFVNGQPIGLLFSDNETISDFSVLPTDRGVWNSNKKFQSFYADGSWHDFTCQFSATADTMYAHLVLNGLADCASVSQVAEVKLKKFIETSIEFGIKKIFGRWGNQWYRYLADEGGSTVTVTPNFNSGIDVAGYTIDGVGGDIYVPIEANPSGAAGSDLSKLKVGSNIYGIQTGTTVVANPQGTATAQLTKISIGGVIYSLPSGGGGGQVTENQYNTLGQSENSTQISENVSAEEVR